jgi:hypothetical protein
MTGERDHALVSYSPAAVLMVSPELALRPATRPSSGADATAVVTQNT